MSQTADRTPSDRGSSAEIARTLAETAARRRAVVISGHTGDVEVATSGLGDAAPEVRASALHALSRLGHLTRSALEEAITDDDPAVRRAGAEIAATWRDPADPPTSTAPTVDLLPLLADPVPEVVEVAAWACGEQAPTDEETARPADARVVSTLADLATAHDDALVRESAVAALGALGDPHGLPAILLAMQDKATVRRRAVIALAPFDGADVDAALEQALTDRDWQVRQAAEDLLA